MEEKRYVHFAFRHHGSHVLKPTTDITEFDETLLRFITTGNLYEKSDILDIIISYLETPSNQEDITVMPYSIALALIPSLVSPLDEFPLVDRKYYKPVLMEDESVICWHSSRPHNPFFFDEEMLQDLAISRRTM